MLATPLLSLAIWVPILAGFVVLATGADRNAPLARMLALLGGYRRPAGYYSAVYGL
jgi:NADH-quinone oxidoreductase subunit M